MSIVIGLSRTGGGDGGSWTDVGERAHCGVGNGPTELALADVCPSVIENLLASA